MVLQNEKSARRTNIRCFHCDRSATDCGLLLEPRDGRRGSSDSSLPCVANWCCKLRGAFGPRPCPRNGSRNLFLGGPLFGTDDCSKGIDRKHGSRQKNRTLTWWRSHQCLRGRALYGARKGPTHGMIGLILDRHFTKMGFRVWESDETGRMTWSVRLQLQVMEDRNLLIVRRPHFKPSVFDIDTLPACEIRYSISHLIRS